MPVTRANTPALLGPEDLRELLFLPVEVNSIAAQCSTVIYTGSHVFRLPVMTAEPSAAWVPEGAEIPPSDPTVGEVQIAPAKVAGLTVVSNEMVADSQNQQAAEQIGLGLARDIARKVDAAFFTTTTTNGPAGLGSLTAASAPIAVAQAATIANSDAFVEGVFKATAKNATLTHWVVNPAEAEALARVKESTTSARGLLQPDPTQPGRRTIEGLPVVVSSAVPARTMYGVDASQSLLVIREDATVESDPSPFFTSDRTAVRAVMRVGWGWTNPTGIVRITRAAS